MLTVDGDHTTFHCLLLLPFIVCDFPDEFSIITGTFQKPEAFLIAGQLSLVDIYLDVMFAGLSFKEI